MPAPIEPLFAERTKWMRASDVREILKYTEMPDIISFGGGLPSPDSFPLPEIERIFAELLRETNAGAFQYGPTQGDSKLRAALAKRLAGRGVRADPANILVTHGAQQAIELLGRVLVDPGDTVITTQPTYLGLFTALATYRPAYHGIPMDGEGILTDILEEDLRAFERIHHHPKFIYIVPTFHNPAGVTVSARRRRRLADLAAEFRIPVIEDDPYYDLRFEGEDLPPVAAADAEGWVVSVGSFSKILAPGFRVGWAAGHTDLIAKMSLAKQGVDLFTNSFGQRVAERYLDHGMLDRHLPRVRAMYRAKRDVMLRAMEEHFPEGVTWTRPQGGLFLWVTVPPDVDTKALLPRAAERGVVYVPGHGFFAGAPKVNHMRLNYSFPSEAEIRRGIEALGGVLAARESAAPAPGPPSRATPRRARLESSAGGPVSR